jgi:hypothetical protein
MDTNQIAQLVSALAAKSSSPFAWMEMAAAMAIIIPLIGTMIASIIAAQHAKQANKKADDNSAVLGKVETSVNSSHSAMDQQIKDLTKTVLGLTDELSRLKEAKRGEDKAKDVAAGTAAGMAAGAVAAKQENTNV